MMHPPEVMYLIALQRDYRKHHNILVQHIIDDVDDKEFWQDYAEFQFHAGIYYGAWRTLELFRTKEVLDRWLTIVQEEEEKISP